jgi:hypothetical protein
MAQQTPAEPAAEDPKNDRPDASPATQKGKKPENRAEQSTSCNPASDGRDLRNRCRGKADR